MVLNLGSRDVHVNGWLFSIIFLLFGYGLMYTGGQYDVESCDGAIHFQVYPDVCQPDVLTLFIGLVLFFLGGWILWNQSWYSWDKRKNNRMIGG